MFVLMMIAFQPVLSDAAPGTARQVGFGARFQYWRGRSARHLFSAVPFEALGDFRSSVVILAEPAGDGRFLAWKTALIDEDGRLTPDDGFWPAGTPHGSVAFVHFLAESEAERQALIEDLFGEETASPLTQPAAFELAA